MQLTATHKILVVALVVYLFDQVTKAVVMRVLDYADQYVIVEGFFKFVHWGNTGAAFSMFHGNNAILAFVSLAALVVLLLTRRHFEISGFWGQVAIGLILGGILGNLTDRLRVGHVIDFLRFHLTPRGGEEIGFPAFNLADSAICLGVGLLFLQSFHAGAQPAAASENPAKAAPAADPESPV